LLCLWLTLVSACLGAPTILDLDSEARRQVVVDREPGQYLGHPSTCLLEDGRTILCVYPKGHGRGAIVYKRSTDGGLTWSERLPTPANWATSLETPTIHRVVDASGKKRLILWSGLCPARLAVSEDDGATWSELRPAGDWGGIVVMGSVVPLKTAPGQYLAMFHDDGRFFAKAPRQETPVVFTLYKTFSRDGGLTWSFPEAILQASEVHLCEPGVVRSPDGKRLAALLRENSRRRNSHIMLSDDEGRTWSAPRELPDSLNGDRHTAQYAPHGRLVVSFRSVTPEGKTAPFDGDWVAWVGAYDDLVQARAGQYVVRLKHNLKGRDCAYPGVEVLPDGTFVTTTYGHWSSGEQPYILSVRFKLAELDARAAGRSSASATVRVVVETELGELQLELDAHRAPITAANFLRYVEAGFYDGGRFHRTVTMANSLNNPVKIEVVQAGPNPAREKAEFPPIKLERTSVTGLHHRDGTVSMARAEPDTATADFFICLGDQPELDFGGKRNPDGQGFAAFGHVVRGMEVVRKIHVAPTDGQGLTPPVKILKARRVK
jgi:cyclophilin family peptidyl-prolyl cis-trans isomerase